MSDRKKAPAYQCYAPNELMETLRFTPAKVGAYTRLRWYSWMHGVVPKSAEDLHSIIGGGSVRESMDLFAAVIHLWNETADGYVANDLEQQRTAHGKLSLTNSLKGLKSAEVRRNREPNRTTTAAQPLLQPDDEPEPPPDGHRNSTGAAPEPQPNGNSQISDLKIQDQDQRSATAPNCAKPVQNQGIAPLAVVTRLAHDVYKAVDDGQLHERDVSEELKTRVAKAKLGLYDGRLINKALESALFQRQRTRRA